MNNKSITQAQIKKFNELAEMCNENAQEVAVVLNLTREKERIKKLSKLQGAKLIEIIIREYNKSVPDDMKIEDKKTIILLKRYIFIKNILTEDTGKTRRRQFLKSEITQYLLRLQLKTELTQKQIKK